MSASSSSTNTSANTGPSRFRRDAASFSPSQHSPSLINQQMFQQQVQHQQMYAPYIYGSGAPMIPNQFYSYIPHYMMPAGAGGQYHPEGGYYPYGNFQQIPPPHVAYANTMNPAAMSGAGEYHQRVKSNPKRNQYNASSGSNSTSSQQALPVNQANASPKFEKPAVKKDLDKTEAEKETVFNEKENFAQDESAINSKKQAQDGEPTGGQGSSNPAFSFPLVINTTLAEFKEKQQSANKTRETNFKAKQERLNQLVQFRGNDKSVLFGLQQMRVVDYNTNTVIIKNENFNVNNEIDENVLDNENNHETHLHNQETGKVSKMAQDSNWASIIKSSQPIKKPTPKPKPSNQSTNPASSPASLSPVARSSQYPATELKTDQVSETNGFSMENESSQPLGVLLLKVAFDPNFNIFMSNNQVPVFKLKTRGLTNTGNICYMNSILQVLIYCEPFNRLLKLIESKSVGTLGKGSPTPLVDATISFIREFTTNNNENKSISPESFYMNLIAHEKFQHLKWGQQEDAEEFLGYYLDGLNEEFSKAIKSLNTSQIDSIIQTYSNNSSDPYDVKKFKTNIKNAMKLFKKDGEESSERESNNEWSEVGANNKKISVRQAVEVEPTPIAMIFGGQFKSVLTTPKLSNSSQISVTLDPLQNIQLDISESNTIEDALINLNHIESINYKSSNDSEISLKKQTFIDRLPSVLVIHLKRFSYLKDQEVGIEKLRKKVAYGHSLTIPQEILATPQNADYKLIGVVYHHGSSADGGHYTSDVLKSASFVVQDESAAAQSPSTTEHEEWIRIDDTSVKAIDEDMVLGGGVEDNIKCAYILFYQKI